MESARNVEKSPQTYDAYRKIELDFYRTLAAQELHETPEVAGQSLQLMREWIAKHPSIKACRTDASFLMRFLRVEKFNHVAACQTLEQYLTMRQANPDWFQQLDVNDPSVEDLINDGFILPLGRNSKGQMVILFRYGRCNYERYGAREQVRFLSMMLETYCEDDLTQIAGIEIIIDHSETAMSMVSAWSLSDLKRYIDFVNDALPLRVTQVHIVSFPLYAVAAGEWALSCCGEKVKSRVQCHRSGVELAKNIDRSLLLTESGGDLSAEVVKSLLRKRLRLYRDVILGLDEMAISKSGDMANGPDKMVQPDAVGYFRKLTVE